LKEQVPSHVHLHTRAPYDSLKREEAKALVRLRTGMSPLKGFMGDIYRFAEQTLIFLATEEVNDEGIERIKGLPHEFSTVSITNNKGHFLKIRKLLFGFYCIVPSL
jgi:hypothetical protein